MVQCRPAARSNLQPPMPKPARESLIQRFELDLPGDVPSSFERFAAVVGPMFDLVRVDADRPYFARSSVSCLTDLILSRAVAAASRFERGRKTIARSGTDDVVVLAYLSGRFTFEIDRRQELVEADEIAFFDLSQPLCIQTEHVDNVSLLISRRRLSELGLSLQDVHGFVLRQGALKALLLAHMRALAEQAPEIRAVDSPAIADATIRMVGACLHPAARHMAAKAAQAGLASLVEIKAFIEGALGHSALGPGLLLVEFNLSRATLYRLFEPVGGVAAYILDRRLRRAVQMLTAPHTDKPRIKQLAIELGFAHPSAFTRAFKKRFGFSPNEVRSLQGYVDNPLWAVPEEALGLLTKPELAQKAGQGSMAV